jgi:hypothetical protein
MRYACEYNYGLDDSQETARTQLNISIYFRAIRVLFELNNSFKYTQKP